MYLNSGENDSGQNLILKIYFTGEENNKGGE